MSRRVHYESRTKTLPGEMPLAGTLAIVGRPNVGKSTLFNRLVGSRRAIVGDEPGITRDRLYGEAEWAGQTLRVVDTGGIIPDDKALIPSEIFRQAKVALEQADAIVMVVDGRTELAAPDLELARQLQRLGKPLILAVNKMDTPNIEPYAQEFRRLGIKELLPISAETGNGVAELLEHVLRVFPHREPVAEEEAAEVEDEELAEAEDGVPAEPSMEEEEEEAPKLSKVAIIGRPNVGKSTLLNALTGTDRAIVSPIAGTTRDAVDELVTTPARPPLRRHRRHPPQGQDPPHGREALRHHGAQAPRSRRRLPPHPRRHRRRHRPRRQHRRLRPRVRPLRHHRRQQVGPRRRTNSH